VPGRTPLGKRNSVDTSYRSSERTAEQRGEDDAAQLDAHVGNRLPETLNAFARVDPARFFS
jgi:hypothetical protein